MATAVRYKVVLYRSEEGVAVQCPALPGCWSQGDTDEEALENIADAVKEYLASLPTYAGDGEEREVEVATG